MCRQPFSMDCPWVTGFIFVIIGVFCHLSEQVPLPDAEQPDVRMSASLFSSSASNPAWIKEEEVIPSNLSSLSESDIAVLKSAITGLTKSVGHSPSSADSTQYFTKLINQNEQNMKSVMPMPMIAPNYHMPTQAYPGCNIKWGMDDHMSNQKRTTDPVEKTLKGLFKLVKYWVPEGTKTHIDEECAPINVQEVYEVSDEYPVSDSQDEDENLVEEPTSVGVTFKTGKSVYSTVAKTVEKTVGKTVTQPVASTVSETVAPTVGVTVAQTVAETAPPTKSTTVAQTVAETAAPTRSTTVAQTVAETAAPTRSTTVAQTVAETAAPTKSQTVSQTVAKTTSHVVDQTPVQTIDETVGRTLKPPVAKLPDEALVRILGILLGPTTSGTIIDNGSIWKILGLLKFLVPRVINAFVGCVLPSVIASAAVY